MRLGGRNIGTRLGGGIERSVGTKLGGGGGSIGMRLGWGKEHWNEAGECDRERRGEGGERECEKVAGRGEGCQATREGELC